MASGLNEEKPVLPFSEACERNKLPILEVLRGRFADRQHVLEIGSGTGQHAVYFAAALPHVAWHPTEQLAYLSDLAQRVRLEGGTNLMAPTLLDVKQTVWPLRRADAIFTANTLHIMSWAEVAALFRGIGDTLTAGGLFCVYGPFRYEGRYTSASNESFDLMLKERDPHSGLREIGEVSGLAAEVGLRLEADHDLPAFNRLLVYIKEPL
jgi:cyclopropane fatty-acyl-phospholipid synthase-like methyltransferase